MVASGGEYEGRMYQIEKPNRAHKRKLKKGSGCKMCKPHKGKWAPFFTDKEMALRGCSINGDDEEVCK